MRCFGWLRPSRKRTFEDTQPAQPRPPVRECTECGFPRIETDRDPGGGWLPCPTCQATTTIIKLHFTATATAQAAMSATHTAGGLERDAARRWREATARVAMLRQPHSSHATRESMAQLQADLYAIFIDIMTLREFSEVELAGTVPDPKGATFGAIRADKTMALAHDLGNLAKHPTLKGSTQSSVAPSYGRPSMTVTGINFTFDIDITHANDTHSALDIAEQALVGWETALQGWHLL